MDKINLHDKLWYQIDNSAELFSPSLIVYPDRIEFNIRKMIKSAGDVKRLRPHVKTHKTAEIVILQMKHGINKFKCATVAEAEMVAGCGAADVLFAMQPVGPNSDRFFKLRETFGNTKFTCIADSKEIIQKLSEISVKKNIETGIWLDINNGMNRSGVSPGEEAIKLYKLITMLPMLKAEGLHVYDGHIHEHNYTERERICNEAFALVEELTGKLTDEGTGHVKIIAGGTPTFPIHALRSGIELSPGTLILNDHGYSSSFADMNYLNAAVLLTRITSKPGKDLMCLDLGHKAVASEMPQPRVKIYGLENYTIVGHNEEHMVVRTKEAEKYNIGDPFYCIPWHICPTADRYDSVYVAFNQKVTEEWNVVARKRKITI
jgi:D-serine deaminase-like pyridoxal phosphate-dependent protein